MSFGGIVYVNSTIGLFSYYPWKNKFIIKLLERHYSLYHMTNIVLTGRPVVNW